jgi:uncharacterized membrane protein
MMPFLNQWAALFANQPILRTTVDFLHIGGLVAAAGCALTADLATISAATRTHDLRRAQLDVLKRTHPIVVTGLILLSVSGLMLFAADVSTYLHSTVFWLKLGLIALLVVNGTLMVAAARRAARGHTASWRHLHKLAVMSLLLWGLTTLAGAALPNLA